MQIDVMKNSVKEKAKKQKNEKTLDNNVRI